MYGDYIPDGLVVIKPEEVSQVLERVPAKDLCGIGKKTEHQLDLYGIKTCGDLGRFPVNILRKKFGIIGERLHQMGLGIDNSPVIPSEDADEVKSVGHSMTLERDIEDRNDILKFLLQLSEMVGRRARRYNVRGKTVTLSIRYADFDTCVIRQETLPSFINQSEEIYRAAVAILDTLVLMQPVRLLGVRLSHLRYESNQLSLFPEERKKAMLVEAMDKVNDRYGDFSVTFGSLLDNEKAKERGSHVISPAWRPEGIRNVDVK
jgi:DNA polymerase-4